MRRLMNRYYEIYDNNQRKGIYLDVATIMDQAGQEIFEERNLRYFNGEPGQILFINKDLKK